MVVMRNTLFKKFMKNFVLIMVIPILIINISLNIIYKSILLKQYSQKNQELTNRVAFYINNELKMINGLAFTIAHDESFTVLLNRWCNCNNYSSKFDISKKIDNKLNYLNLNNNLNSIVFFLKDKGFFCYKKPLFTNEFQVRQEKWYKTTKKESDSIKYINPYKINSAKRERDYISLAINPITSIHNEIEIIYFEFNTFVFDVLNSKYNNEYENFIIVNRNGELIGDNNNIKFDINELKEIINIDTRTSIKTINNNKYYINKKDINNSNWYLLSIVEYDKLLSGINNIFAICVLIYIILILVFIIYSFFFMKKVINPLNTLTMAMRNFDSLETNKEIELDGDLEILQLKKAYNMMTRRIRVLTEEKEKKENLIREEEIRALKAQINPKFLHKTLNSIRLMAKVSNAKPIEKMIDAFIKLTSSIFKNTNVTNKLKDEIENINNYIEIVKDRFEYEIIAEYDMDENTKELLIDKFLLQQVIQNSIFYRFSDFEGKGKIIIKSYTEGEFLIVEILDNGYVIDKTSLIDFIEKKENDSNDFYLIGIANVKKRIKLNYGDKYGLEIINKQDKYSCVKFYLPIIREGIKE